MADDVCWAVFDSAANQGSQQTWQFAVHTEGGQNLGQGHCTHGGDGLQSIRAPWHIRGLDAVNCWSVLPRTKLFRLGHRQCLGPVTEPGAGEVIFSCALQGWEMEESCGSEGWKLVFSGIRRKSAPLPADWQLQNMFSATTAGGGLGCQSIKVSALA